MNAVDALIERIVSSSQVPSGRRRSEIERELRTHVEDFMLIARQAGHADADIQRLVLANFGDPREIAREFAWVYRRERAIFRISVFLLATLVAASVISGAVLLVQASMAIGLGVPVPRVFGGRHLTFEVLSILATVAAYAGLISLEKLFGDGRFKKATASLAVILTILAAALAVANLHAEILVFGFISGVTVRAIQVFLRNKSARIVAVVASFGIFGIVSGCLQPPDLRNEALLKVGVWLAIGGCCHLLTYLAARMDRALLNGVQEV